MTKRLPVAACIALTLVTTLAAQREPRFPRNAAEFDQVFQQVSNWGRWGKDGELGSANLLTAAKRKQALGLARDGVSVSLAHNPLTERAEDNPSPFEHTMNPGLFMDTWARRHLRSVLRYGYYGQV